MSASMKDLFGSLVPDDQWQQYFQTPKQITNGINNSRSF
jgi:hypothetical protein